MDPDATLARIRAIVAVFHTTDNGNLDLAVELTDYVANLDTWLTGGGFLPSAWIQS